MTDEEDVENAEGEVYRQKRELIATGKSIHDLELFLIH